MPDHLEQSPDKPQYPGEESSGEGSLRNRKYPLVPQREQEKVHEAVPLGHPCGKQNANRSPAEGELIRQDPFLKVGKNQRNHNRAKHREFEGSRAQRSEERRVG